MVFYTSDVSNAGTTGNACVQIEGEKGRTSTMVLENLGSNFKRAGVDEFRRQLPSVGRITRVAVACNAHSAAQSWHLEQLELMDMSTGSVSSSPGAASHGPTASNASLMW